jgi:hypothetical protein
MKKYELIKLQQVDHILNEMRILHNVDHTFIVIFIIKNNFFVM